MKLFSLQRTVFDLQM